MGNWLKTIGFLIACAVLTNFVPFSSFFRNLDTMIHEFGHAIVTLALSGKVMYIELYSDHSGVTYSSITKSWSVIPVSLAGYMIASLFSWYLFSAYAKGRQRWGLQVITILAVLSLVLFVRNGFGLTWLAGFIGLNLLMMIIGKILWIRNFYYLLLAFLCLEESVSGAFSLMIYAFLDPQKAGDATNLSQATGVPALFWAAAFTCFALWCAKNAVQAFLGRHKRAKAVQASPPYYRERV
jgi:hypothetical protein